MPERAPVDPFDALAAVAPGKADPIRWFRRRLSAAAAALPKRSPQPGPLTGHELTFEAGRAFGRHLAFNGQERQHGDAEMARLPVEPVRRQRAEYPGRGIRLDQHRFAVGFRQIPRLTRMHRPLTELVMRTDMIEMTVGRDRKHGADAATEPLVPTVDATPVRLKLNCCSAASFDPPESLRINTLPRRSASKLRAEQHRRNHSSRDPRGQTTPAAGAKIKMGPYRRSNLNRTEPRPIVVNRLRVVSPMGFGNSSTHQRSGDKT